MSEDGEKSGGSGLGGVVGAGAGGAAAYHFGSKAISNNGLKQAMMGDEKAPKKVKENLGKVLEKDSALNTRVSDYKTAKGALAKDAAKEAKTAFAKTEKALLTDVQAAGKAGKTGFGFKSMSGGMTGGKAKVIGLTVAGVAVGGMVAHKLFGGRHSNREAERRVQQDLGAYR